MQLRTVPPCQHILPRKCCMCWKRMLVQSLAGKHLSPLEWQHTVQLSVIEFVAVHEQDWRPSRLHCLLLLPPRAWRTLHSVSPRRSPGGTQVLRLARHRSGLPQSHSSPASLSTTPSPHCTAVTGTRQWLSAGFAKLVLTAVAVQFEILSLFLFTPDEENRLIRNLPLLFSSFAEQSLVSGSW